MTATCMSKEYFPFPPFRKRQESKKVFLGCTGNEHRRATGWEFGETSFSPSLDTVMDHLSLL